MAGHSWKISGQLALPADRAGADVPDGGDRRITLGSRIWAGFWQDTEAVF